MDAKQILRALHEELAALTKKDGKTAYGRNQLLAAVAQAEQNVLIKVIGIDALREVALG
jgi:hypothetical protein